MTTLQLLSALTLGLAGAGHCLGMCGGIAAALNLGGEARPGTTIAYHAGRICSYTLLGGTSGRPGVAWLSGPQAILGG